MELNHLKYFYEVVRAGSFTEASKKMRVSQPSISKLVKQLEEQQGVRLLDRGKRGVTLTEFGRIYFSTCQNIFNELDELNASLVSQKKECAGELRIGASDNLCNYVLPKVFSNFHQAYPKVIINLLSGAAQQITNDILADNLELGLFYTPGSDKRVFEITRLWEVEFVVVCGAENKTMREHGFSPKGLQNMGYVGSRQSDYAKPYPALAMLRASGIDPKIIFETNSQETQKKMAIANFGYTVIPKHMVESGASAGNLKIIKINKKLSAHVFLVKRRNRTLTKQGQLIVDFIKNFDYK